MSEQLAFEMAEVGLDVPQGYKRTEVGVIPEDWDCKKLGDLGDVVRGGSPRPAGDSRFFNGNFIPWLTVASLTNIPDSQMYVTQTLTKLTEQGSKQSRILEKNTLIISNSGATLGVAKILGIRCCANDGVAAILNQKLGHAPFLVHFINTKTQELHDTVATGNGQPNLNTDLIKKISVPFPPKLEQNAIATALSGVDALINELEQLIAKKQAIKTATMQQLLTGHTRLPQFALRDDGSPKGYKASELGEIPEDWDICLLQDAVDFLDGLRRPVKSSERLKIQGTYPYYGASGIVDYVNDYLFDDELILLGEDGENILSRNLPLAFQVSGKIWVNNHAHVMKPKAFFNITYLTSYLESLDYSLLNSGTAQPKLNKQSCLKIKINNPSFQEQTAIASILTDMDSDISSLQQRLSKTRQIKQGMMQELLTGKTRLKT